MKKVKKGTEPYYVVVSLTDSDTTLMYDTNIVVLIRNLDKWLGVITDFSLMGELNEMQTQAMDYENAKSVFQSKFTIPLYFINLILFKFNLKIEKE